MSATASRSVWSRCWSMTTSRPASSYARSFSTASSTVPTIQSRLRSSASSGSSSLRARARRRRIPRLRAVGSDGEAGHQRAPDRRGVAAGALTCLVELPPALGHLGDAREDRVVLVGEPHGGLERSAARAPADDQGRPRALQRLRQALAVLEPIVAARERRPLLRQQPVDDLDLLGEALEARREAWKLEPVGAVLVLQPAGAHPELDAAPEAWSAVTTALARTAGWRNVAGDTSVPRRT